MAGPGSGTVAETYVEVESQVGTVAQTRVASKSQQVARYLADDLQDFVRRKRIGIAASLGIPRGYYVRDQQHLVELIFNDIEHMLRDRLITGVHLILSEPALDKNTHRYKVLYHARYEIHLPERSLVEEVLPEYGGRLDAGIVPTSHTRFALLIDWAPSVTAKAIEKVHRPHYLFDWVPVGQRYDTTGTVRLRVGGLGNVVARFETIQPAYIPSR